MDQNQNQNSNAQRATDLDIQDRIKRLEQQVNDLSGNYFKNNFSDHQDFGKYCAFNNKLKVPHYDTLPTTSEVGEIVESGGVLYISTATDTWTVVGTQT